MKYCAHVWFFKTRRTCKGVWSISILLYLWMSVSAGLRKLLSTGEKAQYEDQVVDTWASLHIMVFCETRIYVITGGLLGQLLELKSGRVLLGACMFIILESVWVCTGVSICTCIWLHLSMCLHTCACMFLWSFVWKHTNGWVFCVHVCACSHACGNVHMCVHFMCMHVYTCMHTCKHMNVCMGMCLCRGVDDHLHYSWIGSCMYMHAHVCMFGCMPVCIHAHVHYCLPSCDTCVCACMGTCWYRCA